MGLGRDNPHKKAHRSMTYMAPARRWATASRLQQFSGADLAILGQPQHVLYGNAGKLDAFAEVATALIHVG